MKTLIVTADDLGLRADVDVGIVRAHTEGIVTHASWLAGGESASGAAALVAQEAPGLGVGLHLSLSQTLPSGPREPLASLLTAPGTFPHQQFAAILWARSRQRLATIWNEWQAQADAFEETWGRVPTHLDSHQHIHLAPQLQPLAVRLAVERGIPRLRAPSQPARGRLDVAVFSLLGRRLGALARARGVTVPARFDGFHASGRLRVAELEEMRERLTDALTEWMTHPGMLDEPSGYLRLQELESVIAVHVQEAPWAV